ncbi:unnamed protein product [Triticum turgidum subsp. durum]|uniref:Uncharacterized protein n=1 Tax=Triticum turgidum subsp. durum TaxID=4567 RepID=A0A9R0RXJ1_TRITD|nr:unnamed protein product [Triticum turgidum subsp. durum]
MVAAPAGPGGGGPSLSPCAGFVADSLILPTRNVRLFAPVLALVLAHTFLFLAVAVHFAHDLYGFLLPSAGVQLYSTVAATVFYHRGMEQQRRRDLAIPLMMKDMKLGGTPLNSLKLIKGATID